MFKATNMLKRKNFENPFVHEKNGKHVLKPEELCKIIKDHIKCHLCEESIEFLPPFTGKQKNLDKPVTAEEVRLNSSWTAGPERYRLTWQI